jgi:hypothetical protein
VSSGDDAHAAASLARCPVGGARRVLARDAILLAIVTAVLAGLVAGRCALVRSPATA